MKIIDFERKGNIVRFYLGDDNLQEYYGDDWDDAPYDCNAGTVYDKFVSGHIDVYFPFDAAVLEPCNGVLNCGYTKDDMARGIVPCILVVPAEELAKYSWKEYDFAWWAGSKTAFPIYFGDDPVVLLEEHNALWMNFNLQKKDDNSSEGNSEAAAA